LCVTRKYTSVKFLNSLKTYTMKKTIFITGATSGIGEACARLFATQNYRLVICGRRKEALEALKNELSNQTEVYSLIFDVRNYQEVENAVQSS